MSTTLLAERQRPRRKKAIVEQRRAHATPHHGVFMVQPGTGRGAWPELIAFADRVTEMGAVKHAFQAGVRAQKGVGR